MLRRSPTARTSRPPFARPSRANGGWLPFAAYMQIVLYAPGLGYYVAGARKFGAAGDFVTAPELTPLFARSLAVQIRAIRERSGGDVLELGAGTGRLAADLLASLRGVRRRGRGAIASSSRRPSCAIASERRSSSTRARSRRASNGSIRCRSSIDGVDRDERGARCASGSCRRASRRRRGSSAASSIGGGGFAFEDRALADGSLRRLARGPLSLGRRLRERAQSRGGGADRESRPPPALRRDARRRLRLSATRVLPSAAHGGHADRPLPASRARRSVALAGAVGPDRARGFHGDRGSGRARRPRGRGIHDAGRVPARLRHPRPRCGRSAHRNRATTSAKPPQSRSCSRPPKWASCSR